MVKIKYMSLAWWRQCSRIPRPTSLSQSELVTFVDAITVTGRVSTDLVFLVRYNYLSSLVVGFLVVTSH